MQNYVQKGEVITMTPTAGNVAAGQGLLVGTLFGVATANVAQNTPGEFITEGVVDIAKTSALEITAGSRVFWVPGSSVVNTTSAGQVCVGVAIATAPNPSPTVRIKLGAVTPSGT